MHILKDYQLGRINVWKNPIMYSRSGGYQVLQGLYAIGSGGLFGKGLGESLQKLGFVPEAQNDMIFSIICEELGLFGAISLILIFMFMIYRFMVIAGNAPDLLGAMIVTGVTVSYTHLDVYKRQVEDRKIRCHKVGGHGGETFLQGMMNSCNPVLIDVGQRLGVDNYYKYFAQFGLLGKTGIDLPGEAATIMHKKENMGLVELATVSFGQSFQITPLQLITTASSVINGGNRVTPHLAVKSVSPQTGSCLLYTSIKSPSRVAFIRSIYYDRTDFAV